MLPWERLPPAKVKSVNAATEPDQSNQQHVTLDSTRFFRDEKKSVQTGANNFKAGHVLIQLNNSLDT